MPKNLRSIVHSGHISNLKCISDGLPVLPLVTMHANTLEAVQAKFSLDIHFKFDMRPNVPGVRWISIKRPLWMTFFGINWTGYEGT